MLAGLSRILLPRQHCELHVNIHRHPCVISDMPFLLIAATSVYRVSQFCTVKALGFQRQAYFMPVDNIDHSTMAS